jgi:16S rRNA (uracil1498-N3)-methyltransferase
VDRADSDEDGVGARRLHFGGELSAERFALDEAAAQHARVLRLAVGDSVELFDGRGSRLAARIEQLGKGRLHCVATGPVQFEPRGPLLVLVQCVVKGKKLDDIVRMTTELGVGAIHLAVSERCVVQKSARDEHKVERLARIASEAARQAEQAYVPEIVEPAPLAEVLRRAPDAALKCALLERSEAVALPSALGATAMWLAVGPEGGFSCRDREILSHAKFAAAGLGRAILRTETAAVVGVALGFSALGRGR